MAIEKEKTKYYLIVNKKDNRKHFSGLKQNQTTKELFDFINDKQLFKVEKTNQEPGTVCLLLDNLNKEELQKIYEILKHKFET